ncbi:hypothetical protein [Ekhidna sp.]|uniref:hypothetical protein n=1 Tax=Ekhidna sp. TaxID=2608089 RepID=UPI003C7BB0E7
MKKLLLSLSIFTVLFRLYAQEDQEKDTITIEDYYIDFAVPDLSALGMLGIENDEIVRPGNLKKFAAGIANFVDTDGSLKQALALEWNFMNTYNKKNPINFDKVWQPRNLALSLATSEEDSLGLRLGFGLKWVPLDKGDPMGDSKFYYKISTAAKSYYGLESFKKEFDFPQHVETVLDFGDRSNGDREIMLLAAVISAFDISKLDSLRKDFEESKVTNMDSLVTKRLEDSINELISQTSGNPISTRVDNAFVDANLNSKKKRQLISKYVELILSSNKESYQDFESYIATIISKEKEKYRERNWNAEALMVATGVVGHSTTSTYNDLTGEKFSIFASYAMPTLGGMTKQKLKGQMIVQFKYETDFTGDSIDFNHISLGFKHLFGNSDNRLSTEALFSSADTELLENNETSTETYLRYTIGAELKISDGTWLEIAFGGQKFFEGEAEENAILTNFGFKHALRNKRRYDIK